MAVIGFVWAILLTRGVIFLADTKQAYGEIGSLNANADYQYARQLLVCYISGAVATELLVGLLIVTRNAALLPHVILALTVMFLILAAKPESGIVLIPPIIRPLFLMSAYGFVLLCALLIVLGARMVDQFNRKYPVYGLNQ